MATQLPLVGREGERSWFQKRLQARTGAIVLLTGEGGSGKTRLLQTWLGDAAAAGYRTATGSCPGPGEASAFRPWREALRRLNLTLPVAADSYDLAEQLVTSLSGDTPVALALEDMQWADQASLDLLRNMASHASTSALLVVVTYRNAPDLERLLLRSGAERVRLERLSLDQVTQLAHAAGRSDSAAGVYRRTGGNPFLVTELLSSEDGATTPAICTLVADRLSELTPVQQETLRVAAVFGDWFGAEALQQVTGQPEAALLELLEGAIRAGLLHEEPQGFTFDLPIMRELLYGGTLTARRRRWHQQIAAAVQDPDQSAFHLGEAGTAEAVPHLREAGDRAMRAGNRARASGFYQQALSLMNPDHVERAELLLLAGAAGQSCDFASSHAFTTEARKRARTSGDAIVGALARYREAILSPGDSPRLMDSAHGDLVQLRNAERFLRLYELVTGRRPHSAGTPDGLAQAYLWSGRPAEAEAIIRASTAETGSLDLGSLGHWVLAEVALLGGALECAFEHYRRSIADAQVRHDYSLAAFRAGSLLALLAEETGLGHPDVQELRDRAEELGRLAQRQAGAPETVAGASLLGFLYWQGEWDAMRRVLEPCRLDTLEPWWALTCATWQARLDCDQGAPDQARHRLKPLLPPGGPGTKPRYGEYHREMHLMTLMARACRLAGDLAAARAWLETVDAWHAGARPSLWNYAYNRSEWAELHLASGNTDDARTSTVDALELGRRFGSTAGLTFAAHVLLARLGGENAAVHIQHAFRIAGDSGSRVLVERVRAVSDRVRQPGSLGLTRRELDVVRLVARGLTDREVGAQLFLSPRTVDGHLRHVFAKLDLPSRAALAAWAARNGLSES